MQRNCMLDWVLLECGGSSIEYPQMWRYDSYGISITYMHFAVRNLLVIAETLCSWFL